MELKKQLVSLKLAKHLKNLSVKQESLFYHVVGIEIDDEKNGDSYDSWFENGYKEIVTKDRALEAVYIKDSGDWGEEETKNINYYSAFTASELGDILPPRIISINAYTKDEQFLADTDENHKKYEDDDSMEILWLSVGSVSGEGERGGWVCNYGTDDGKISHISFQSKTMADSMANMMIHLLENKIVKK